MPDRFVARLDNFYLDIITTRDRLPASLSIREYPFSNKNDIQHLGQKPGRVTVECVFQQNPPTSPGWSTDQTVALPTYNDHFLFLDYLYTKRDNVTFTHPKYGEMQGKVENIDILTDDTDEYAALSFDFVREVSDEQTTFIRFIIPETAASFRGSTDITKQKFGSDLLDAPNAVTWVANTQSFIATLDKYLNNLTSPVNSIINTINYGTSVPGQLILSINSAIDRIVELYQTSRNSPAAFINNIIVGVRLLKSTLSGVNANRVHIMGASRVAYEAGVIYDEDDQSFREIETKEESDSYDFAGNYKGKAPLPVVMTRPELDASVFQVREFINEVIIFDRDNRDLQEQARKLQDYINKIKLDRDGIETKEYPLQTMHEIAIKSGLSYQAAERILALNPTVVNPNFTEGDIRVLVPATV